jgi:hypothetical protein
MTATETFEAFQQWLRQSPYAEAEKFCLECRAVDVDAYREVFAQAGFPLPPSLLELLTRHGLPRIWLDLDETVLTFDGPGELFESVDHIKAARDAGVKQAEP